MEEGRTTMYKICSSEDREMDVSGTVRAALEQAVTEVLSVICDTTSSLENDPKIVEVTDDVKLLSIVSERV